MKKLLLLFSMVCFASLAIAQQRIVDSLFAITRSSKHDTIKAMAFIHLSKIYTKTDDSVSHKKMLVDAKKLFESAKHPKVGSLYYLILSNYEEKFIGRLSVVNEYLLKSCEYCVKANDKLTLTKRKNKIAHNLVNLGSYNEGIELYYENVALCEEVGNNIGLSYAYFGLAEIFRLQKNYKKALEIFRNAYSISLKNNDPVGISASYNNLGMMHHQLMNLDSAMFYYLKSREFNERIGNELEAAGAMDRIATVYMHKKQNEKALEILKRSLAIKLKYTDLIEITTNYINMAEACHNIKRYEEAQEHLDKAIEYAKKAQLAEHLEYCLKLQAISYNATGKYKQSADAYADYIIMHDSLLETQSNRLITEMETKYQTDKKKKEIELLNKDKLISDADLKKQKQFIYFILLMVVLLITVVVVVVKGLRQKKRDNTILTEKNEIINKQKHIVEEKNKEITDSINYAKRIQFALLAHSEFLQQNLPEHFVYFQPKDIVSGDFYWATKHQDKFYLAVCDSTGHGVPGAFMSLLNIGFLSEAINEKGLEKPNEVFNYVREKLCDSISKEGQKDGFDGILICYDQGRKKVTYAAANNGPILIRNGEIIELPKDKMPVGIGERKESFRLFEPEIQSGDTLYLYTDGYADQFGGPKGKKFKYKQLNELILSNSTQPLNKQHLILKDSFDSWKGNMEQVDDVCIIGIRL